MVTLDDMFAIRAPKTRTILLPILMATVLISFVPYSLSKNTIRFIGLFLDILGATILSIPDVPILWNYSVQKDLRSGLEYLNPSEDYALVRPGSQEMLDEADSFQIDRRTSVYFNTYNKFIKSEYGDVLSHFDKGKADEIYYYTGIQIPDGDDLYNVVSGFSVNGEQIVQIPKSYIDEYVDDQIEKFDKRLRRMGITLLIIGFCLQIISI